MSEVSRPHSGHVYFTLKDAQAQIRGVIWKSTAQRIKFQLAGGAAGRLPRRSRCLSAARDVSARRPPGRAAGARGFAARLSSSSSSGWRRRGCSIRRHKKPLPVVSAAGGLVTSPTGAAVRDFLEVAARRFRGVEILVIPVRVQGDGAAAEIVRGIAAGQSPAAAAGRAGRGPRRRQPGRPVVFQRGSRGAGDLSPRSCRSSRPWGTRST